MAIDERSRHDLYLKLEGVLGPEEATTLMEHLPPVGWADVATKHDLDQLRVATKHDMDQMRLGLEREIQSSAFALTASFRGELIAMERHIVFAMIGAMVSISALVFTAAQIF